MESLTVRPSGLLSLPPVQKLMYGLFVVGCKHVLANPIIRFETLKCRTSALHVCMMRRPQEAQETHIRYHFLGDIVLELKENNVYDGHDEESMSESLESKESCELSFRKESSRRVGRE